MTQARSSKPMALAASASTQAPAGAALQDLVEAAYGALPAPGRTAAHLLHDAKVARWDGASLQSWAVHCDGDPPVEFACQLMLPAGVCRPPVVVSGDGCWAYLDADALAAAAQRGVAVAWFNRTQVSADPPAGTLTAPHGAVHRLQGGTRCGALSAWAWAMHRVVDVLATLPVVDASRIGVAGHSRGGKAALLAGALDARIALTAANNSGTLGAASSVVCPPGGETVDALVAAFPHWVGPLLRDDPRRALPHDQDVLLGAIAPRALILTQARDDLWANPQGMRHVVQRVRERFAQGSAAASLRVVWRDGGHAQQLADWCAVFDASAQLPA